ncbi:MAG: zinc-finger domain-containing protein [Rhodospirillaceae bacterium]
MSHDPTYPVSETIEVSNPEVACDGGKGPLGHPRVYLNIKPTVGYVVCPYCSRKYVLSSAPVAAAH